MRINTLSIIINFCLLTSAFSQNLTFPSLHNVKINSGVVYNNNELMFHYKYTLTNDINNTGNIADIAIDISNYQGAKDIDTNGLQFIDDGFTEGSFRRHFPSLKGKIIPVGFFKVPPGDWTGGLSNHLTGSFFTSSGIILPGQTLGGFELMCKGLPGIRKCVISPDFDFDSLFSEARFPNEEFLSPHFTDSVQNAGKFHSFTIGPTAPPINFTATAWCDTLTSYTTQSRALGWIKDQATANKYLGYFSSARTKLVQRDSVRTEAHTGRATHA